VRTSLSDFAKRQAHGFTGKFQGSMTAPLERKRELLKLRGADPSKVLGVTEDLARRQRSMKAGITSIPGLAKGLVKAPGTTAKSLYREGMGGKKGLAFAVGLPAAMAAPDLAKGDESATGGRTVGQKLLRHGGSTAGFMLAGGLPIIPQMMALGQADKLINRATGGKPVQAAAKGVTP
jgi:hypothetical protein